MAFASGGGVLLNEFAALQINLPPFDGHRRHGQLGGFPRVDYEVDILNPYLAALDRKSGPWLGRGPAVVLQANGRREVRVFAADGQLLAMKDQLVVAG